MIDKNFHTHTYRCGHASGKDEEYVLSAIDFGITELGFTDHIMLKDHPQPHMRGDYSLLDDYVNSLNKLKEKYKDKIKIHIGFEAEAIPYYYPYYKELLDSKKIEYLILGNHCALDENNEIKFYRYTEPGVVNKYVDSLIDGMRTGLFKYVAHPDHYLVGYHHWDDVSINACNRICKVAEELDIPLEINLAHFRSRHYDMNFIDYPYKEFWKIVKNYNIKVILGIDAHNPCDFENVNYENVKLFLKEVGIDYSQNLKFD